MGLMDRDYWREKHKKSEKNSDNAWKSSIYNPRAFRTNTPKPKSSVNLRAVYFVLTIIFALSVILTQRGVTLESIKTKVAIYFKKEDGSALSAAKSMLSANDIIPGIIATTQTNFNSDPQKIEIEFEPMNALTNYGRYSYNHDFYFNIPKTLGSIAYKIVSVDPTNSLINAKINFYMWGAKSPIYTSVAKIDKQACPSKINRTDNGDEWNGCEDQLSYNMSTMISTNISKNIKLQLKQSNNKLLAYYLNENGSWIEIGGFNLHDEAKLMKSFTTTLHFLGVITDCEEMPPVKFKTLSFKANGMSGKSGSHKLDENFKCHSKVINQVEGKSIMLGVK